MAEAPEYYWVNSPPTIIDDSNPMIQYNGEWYAANATDIIGTPFTVRNPMFNTLHVLQISAGSFSYNFTGGGISVFATPLLNGNYTVKCSLDGNPLDFASNAEAEFGQSRPVCQVFGLPSETVHTISVSVSAPLEQQPSDNHLSGFSFDYFLIPPPVLSETWNDDNQDVYLPLLETGIAIGTSTNPTQNFGIYFIGDTLQIADVSRGWEFDKANGFHTTTPGSQFNVTFNGTSAWWYGYYNTTGPGDPFSATFAIDGGEPTKFPDPNQPKSTSQSLHFRTPVLEYATHLLTVTYQSSGTLPLTLQSLIIQKTRQVDVAATPSTRAKRSHIGVIAGGTGGGVIFLLLVACGVWVLTRWTRKRRQSKRTGEHSIAATPEPFPVPISAAAGVLVPRKERASQDGIEHPATQQLQPPPLNKWSRLHTSIAASPDRGRISSSPDTKLQDEGPLDPEPPINPLVILDDSQQPPIVRDTTNQQSGPQTADALSPTRPTPLVSTTLSGAESEREEEGSEPRMASASDVPPAYTTH